MIHHPNNHELFTQLLAIRRDISHMSAGLNALTQAVSDLTAAVTNATNEISTLVGELSSSEDPQVQALADKIEAQVQALNAATANVAIPSPLETPQEGQPSTS